MNSLLSKSFAVGIILLFVGVSISSAIYIDIESDISNNKSEEDCDCNEVSNVDIVKLEKILDRVEVYSKLLLVLCKFNPELKEIIECLSNRISTIKGTLKDISEDSIICDIILDIYDSLLLPYIFLDWYLYVNEPDTIRYLIVTFLHQIVETFVATCIDPLFLAIGVILNCEWASPL